MASDCLRSDGAIYGYPRIVRAVGDNSPLEVLLPSQILTATW